MALPDACRSQSRRLCESSSSPYSGRKSKKIEALSSALGSGDWIHLANFPRHSSSDRHHSGLPAMMPPLHSGKPQASSLRFDRVGERQQVLAHLLRFLAIGLEDDAVVLVGGQRLLVASLRAEGDPAPFHLRQVEFVVGQFDDAQRQQVVQRRDQMGQLVGRRRPAPAWCRPCADVLRAGLQRGQVPRLANVVGDVVETGALQGEQVVLRDDAEQAARIVDHQQVAQAATPHDEGGLVGGGLRLDGDHARRHDRGDRQVERAAGQRHPVQQIAQREDAQRQPAFGVGNDDRADALLVHDPDGLAHRGIQRHRHRLASDEAAQRAVHRLEIRLWRAGAMLFFHFLSRKDQYLIRA